ncbi:MAG: hypothetical protein H3C63_17490, partial [Candidatus Omnitrophica bacterium]|nr:hypothetical protein [Candidatus Omnitrophota bacterium]
MMLEKQPKNIVYALVLLVWVLASPAQAELTKVRVRVLSQDAKLIGSGVGGARITIRDVEQDVVLGQAIQCGGTGDTTLIMKTPHERFANRFPGEDAASVEFLLPLDYPTVVDVTAEGPLAYPQALTKSSKRLLLLPGTHIGGEGIVLTLHGFIVDIMSPESIDSIPEGEAFLLKASVRMLCGCPTQQGGLWDSDDFDVDAFVWVDGKIVEGKDMKYAGEVNVYETTLHAPGLNGKTQGSMEIMV